MPSPSTRATSSAPARLCPLISSYSSSVRRPGLQRIRSGIVTLPTSWRVAAILSIPSISSFQPRLAAIATARSATARECSCSAFIRTSTAWAIVVAQLSSSFALVRSGRPWREA